MVQRIAIAVIGVVLLAVLVPLALAVTAKKEPSEPKIAPVAVKHFLEVGKTYHFGFATSSSGAVCKIIEEPRDNWVRAKIQTEGKSQILWINLGTVSMVMFDPNEE